MTIYEVNVLLTCTHVNIVIYEAAPFIPHKGDKLICKICKSSQTITKVGFPAQMGETAPNPHAERSSKEEKR